MHKDTSRECVWACVQAVGEERERVVGLGQLFEQAKVRGKNV